MLLQAPIDIDDHLMLVANQPFSLLTYHMCQGRKILAGASDVCQTFCNWFCCFTNRNRTSDVHVMDANREELVGLLSGFLPMAVSHTD